MVSAADVKSPPHRAQNRNEGTLPEGGNHPFTNSFFRRVSRNVSFEKVPRQGILEPPLRSGLQEGKVQRRVLRPGVSAPMVWPL